MFRPSYFLLTAALLSLSPIAHAIIPAGEPPFIVGPQRDPITLAQALRKAPVSETQVTLTVGSEAAYLPQEALAPSPEAKAPAIAAAFGFLAYDFHDVTAIAPATMTVLNTNPKKPDAYDGMPPQDAFRLLLGSLNADQWKLLTGKRGLAVSDLVTDAQHALYMALFPDQTVSFIPRKGGFNGISMVEPPPKLEMKELLNARLRLARRTEVNVQIVDQPHLSIGASAPVTGAPEYQAVGGNFGNAPRETVYGVTLRATVPNASKRSDLDDDGDVFSSSIDLTGVKTVGDLVTRIGVVTHTELYVDRRYEQQAVLLLGPTSARAKDLLRALALCVRGAYRKVGPAYVLTNDLAGAGTRTMILTRFEQQAEMARTAEIAAASDKAFRLYANTRPLTVSDVLTMTEAQQKAAMAEYGHVPGSDFTYLAPLGKLTPEQQRLVRTIVRDWNADHKISDNPAIPTTRLTLDAPIQLSMVTTLFLDTDALHGPVVMDSYLNVQEALRPSYRIEDENSEKEFKAATDKPKDADAAKPALPKPPDLGPLFAQIAHRAVVARPHTAEEVDKIIARMKTIGFNELWLDVFSDGKSHLSGNPDILTEALAKTAETGISIVPTLTPLNWGADAPKELQDRTLLSENSAQANTWGHHVQNVSDQVIMPAEPNGASAPPEVFVNPAIPLVAEILTEIIRKVSKTPEVSAIVVLEKAPLGYESGTGFMDRSLGYTLGYTEPLRLAFLRARHVDPIDINPDVTGGPAVSALSIPEFPDYELLDSGSQAWNDFRAGVLSDFMVKLLESARTESGQPVAFLVPTQGDLWNCSWLGLWEDAKKPLPHIITAQWEGGDEARNAVDARKQSRLNIKLLNGAVTDSPTELVEALYGMAPGWDGFVIDLTDGTADDASLEDLAKSLKQTRPK
jgi:hypothetical protein